MLITKVGQSGTYYRRIVRVLCRKACAALVGCRKVMLSRERIHYSCEFIHSPHQAMLPRVKSLSEIWHCRSRSLQQVA